MAVVPPKGLILVTGANGYIGSTMVKVCLEQGYAVRGMVRSASKNQWMLSYFGPNLSLVEVPDLTANGAFGEAVKGVDGVVHIASKKELSQDSSLIAEVVRSVTNLLEAAAKESSVKRVVVTSSQTACFKPRTGEPYKVSPDTWNEEVVEAAKLPFDGKDPTQRGLLILAAAKTVAEQGAFEWVREHKPHFIFNTVVPSVNLGPIVAVEHIGFSSSMAMIESVCRGISIAATFLPSQWFVNVEDTAFLHLAALTIDEVQNERLLAYAEPYSWKQILKILGRCYPERKSKLASIDETATDKGEVNNKRSTEILRKMGRPGFRSLEETLVSSMKTVIEAEALPNKPRSLVDDMFTMAKAE
ncbi:NAD dependent epimerase/dehydratase family protein [Diaporthe sp. PMI_573]|nr:NAD dependent epimerase/dehydratase family protein [Diaporthaceae sp. PMI_573]